MKESILNKKNVHSYPSHIVAVIESGAIARPIVQRKLAAAKYCPRISSGASLEINVCWIPTVISSPSVNNPITKISPQIDVVCPNKKIAIP